MNAALHWLAFGLIVGMFIGVMVAMAGLISDMIRQPPVQAGGLPGWDSRVTHVWVCPKCGLRVGLGGCRSAPPRCSGTHESTEMEQVVAS